MTSSTSRKAKRRLIAYAIVTVLVGLFSFIYEFFSHQVYSPFMVYMFTVPLFLGVIPQMIYLFRPKLGPGGDWQSLIHNFSIAVLTTGSALQGILEIYGTTSNLTPYYALVGFFLLLVSTGLWLSGIYNHKSAPARQRLLPARRM